MRRHLFQIAALAAACLLAGCGGMGTDGSAGTRLPGKTFHYVVTDEPKRLDPAYMYDLFEGIAGGLLYEGLVAFDRGTSVVPGLAEKWSVTPDGRTYTFTLRDAKFSDGKPVTAADVRYSFTRILRPETNSDRRWIFSKVVGADAVTSGTTTELAGLKTPDDRTVVIELTRPYAPFLTMLAMPNAAVIPEGAAGNGKPAREFEDRPVGSGPWVLGKWLHDQRIEFHRNPHYRDPALLLDGLVLLVQKEERVTQQQFDLGSIDRKTISFASYPQWIKDPARTARMMPVNELNTYFIAFMNSKPKFADRRVRQAISLAIDTKNIFDNLQKGRGDHAFGPVPPGVNGYRPHLAPRPHDPQKARQLLAEAGVRDLSVSIWMTDDALLAEMMMAAKADLEKVGIHAELVRRDLPSLRQAIYSGEPDMYFYSWWLDYPDIENALIPSFHSRNIPRSGNGCHYSSPQFDRLVDDADLEPDRAERIRKFQLAEDYIIEDCPVIFIYHRKSYAVVQPWVKNYRPCIMYNAERLVGVDIDVSKCPK